jgi:hypothetical protein
MPKASLSSAVASLVLAWVGVLLPMLGGERLLAQDVDRSLHLFVIDHSYSMMNRSGRGTRWEFVFGKLGEWLETLPADGSADVSILLFNIEVPGKRPRSNSGDPYLIELPKWSAEDRAKAMAYVEDIGEPRDGEGTALWNALGWAGRKIDAEGSRYSDSWIYLFTDGEDTNSRRRAGDRDFTFPEGDDGREPVLAMWRKLLGKHPNTYMIEQPLGDMEPPLAPEVQEPKNKHIYTSRPELRDQLRVNVAPAKPEYPCVSDPQKVELNVRLAGTGKKRVPKDAVFRVSFRSDDPAIQLQVEPERVPFHEGRQSFTVSVKGGQVRDGVKGRLLFGFDPIEKTDILGPTEAKLQFAAVAKVNIASATPGADLRWPVGRPLDLSVKHTGDSVEWSFGDGATATGGSASHAWNAAGTYEVKVVAKAAGMDPAERKFRVEAVPAGLEVQQRPDQGVIAGKPVLFVANPILAKASRYEWSIDGASRAARNPDGNELELRFDTAGSHEVMVRAYTDICVIERKVVVQVGAGLSLRITKFPSTADAGLTAEFGAEFKGASKKGRLLWEIVDSKTGAAVDATASGASAVAAEASAWAPVVPQSAPASVTVRVRAELEDDEKAVYGDVVDEVVVSIRPPGLHVRKERPADAETLVVGEATPFQAAWSGTGAKAVEDIQWEVTRDGKPVIGAQVVKASKSDGLATSQYSVSLPSSGDSLGKQITVTAVPVLGGVPDASHAATWVLSARLPKIDYRVTTNAVSLGGMDYGSALQVGLEPLLHAESVEWDWGDGKVQPAKPNEVLEHTYQLADAGSKRVLARIKRIDGSVEVAQLLFELRAPAFEILNPGAVRINRNAKLKVGPDSLARFVKEVRWDFGAGYGMPETDLETTHLWSDRAGTQPVRAKITLTDGTERLLPELSVNVVASKVVEAAPEVIGGSTFGGVELQAHVAAESDCTAVEVDVLRDGQLVKTLNGTVASFIIGEGEYGTYTYRFRAKRVPSEENPATSVELGEISRSYYDRNYALAVGVLLGGLLALSLILWGGVLYQYPRNWALRVSTDSPLQDDVSLRDIGRSVKFDRPVKGTKSMVWSRFKLRKELRIPTCDLVKILPEDVREPGLTWLVEEKNVLRIDPRRSSLIDSPGEGWDGPETCDSRRDVHIFKRSAGRARPNDHTLYAWLEHKPAPFTGWIIAAVIALGSLAAWFWFAKVYCRIFS